MVEEYRSWNEAEPGPLPPESGVTLVEAVVDALPDGRALDLATGRGRVARVLADRGWTVDAIDISRARLADARGEGGERSSSIDWILADADSYCFPEAAYDLVTIRFFDARDRLPAIEAALAPGGAVVYEHHLQSGPESANAYRFESTELLSACGDLTVRYYAEDRDRSRVWLVALADEAL